ncbi:type VII secretion integral membrane protein EccD [Mycobacteroides abscessus]|uniref:type VII secretion integral membrane protein EccD n=1 Tax=Mycobacteroides abscessus TaxID=36809 RepID=UPI0021027998|nr:type VII secretion integral membrane protein EccD [Mycobacteroides abscessus]
MSNGDQMIRVAILGDLGTADVALPTALPIRDLIPQVRNIVSTGSDKLEADSEQAVTAEDAARGIRPYSLAQVAGTPFSPDAKLNAVGVDDGDLLVLRQVPPGPAAPPVFENIADASAMLSKQMFPSLSYASIRATAAAAFIGVLTFVTGFSALLCLRGHSWWVFAVLAACAVVPAGLTFVLQERSEEVAAKLALATHIPLALTLLLVPGDYGVMRIFLTAAAMAAWSLVLLVVTDRYHAAHTAIIATALPVAGVAVLRTLWDLPNTTLGCVLLAVSLIMANRAPNLAAGLARYPMPYVPAPGEAVDKPPTMAELESLPAKIARSNAFQTGLIAASVVLQVISSVLLVWRPDHPAADTLAQGIFGDVAAWWLVGAAAIVAVLRVRTFDVSNQCLWLLVAPLVVTVTLAVSFAFTGHQWAAWLAVGVLVLELALFAALAALQPKALEIPKIRALDGFEAVLLGSMPVAIFHSSELFMMILNRKVS